MTVDEKYLAPVFKKKSTDTVKTLSPNRKFYYKFQDPDDLYWGLFCCKVAFFSVDNELIYYNAGQLAQCGLDPDNQWTFVFYSQSGDIAFFIERNSTKTLHYVLIDLKNKKIFRKQFTTDEENKRVSNLFAKNGFADNEAINYIGGHFQDLQTDDIEFELKSVFGLTSWRP